MMNGNGRKFKAKLGVCWSSPAAARPAGGSQLEIGRSDWLDLQVGGAIFGGVRHIDLDSSFQGSFGADRTRRETRDLHTNRRQFKSSGLRDLFYPEQSPLINSVKMYATRTMRMFQPTRAMMRPVPVSAILLHAVLIYGVTSLTRPCHLERGTSRYVMLHSASRRPCARWAPRQDDVDSIPNLAHTVSQRLRRLRKIPAELIPLGSSNRKPYSGNGKSLYVSRCCRRFCCLCRRLLVHAPPTRRQDHPSQAPEPRRGQCCPRGLRRAPLNGKALLLGGRTFTEGRCDCKVWES